LKPTTAQTLRLTAVLVILFLSPAFALTVIYTPTLPDGVSLTPVEAAAEFAAGLEVEEDWYYNTPSLFGDTRTALRPPTTLAGLIVYAAQSEADDAVCLRLVETPEGWFGYALRWNRGVLSGASRGTREPEAFDWRSLGRDLAAGRPLVPGDGEPDSLTGVRWLGRELDDGLALAAAAGWLERAPEELTAAFQLGDRAGKVILGLAVVGDVPAVERLLDAVELLVDSARRATEHVLALGAKRSAVIGLYFAGRAAENAWRVTRYASPYRGIGDSSEGAEALAGRIAQRSEAYWGLAVESYRRALDTAGVVEAAGSWVLMARVALMQLYRETGRDMD